MRSCFCQLIHADNGCILITIFDSFGLTHPTERFRILSFYCLSVSFFLPHSLTRPCLYATFAIDLTPPLSYLPGPPLIHFLTCNEQCALSSRKQPNRRDGISDRFIERCFMRLLQCRLSFPFASSLIFLFVPPILIFVVCFFNLFSFSLSLFLLRIRLR